MLLAVFASRGLGMPAAVTGTLLLAVRIYLVIAIGILIIRSTTVTMDTLTGLSERAVGSAGGCAITILSARSCRPSARVWSMRCGLGYDADLYAMFDTLRRAGQRLRAENRDVLSDLELDGIVAFGAKAMTVRISTRVKPGRHETVAAALRLLVKEMFDRQAAGLTRTTLIPTLIPQTLESHETRPAAGV
jgi:hypothetical protein